MPRGGSFLQLRGHVENPRAGQEPQDLAARLQLLLHLVPDGPQGQSAQEAHEQPGQLKQPRKAGKHAVAERRRQWQVAG